MGTPGRLPGTSGMPGTAWWASRGSPTVTIMEVDSGPDQTQLQKPPPQPQPMDTNTIITTKTNTNTTKHNTTTTTTTTTTAGTTNAKSTPLKAHHTVHVRGVKLMN